MASLIIFILPKTKSNYLWTHDSPLLIFLNSPLLKVTKFATIPARLPRANSAGLQKACKIRQTHHLRVVRNDKYCSFCKQEMRSNDFILGNGGCYGSVQPLAISICKNTIGGFFNDQSCRICLVGHLLPMPRTFVIVAALLSQKSWGVRKRFN